MMIHFLVFLTFLKSTIEASTPVTWTSSSYFICGTAVYVPTNMGAVYNQTVYIPYTTTMTGVNRGVNVGIIDFDYQLTDPLFTMIIMNPYLSTTGFWINVTYNVGTYILSGIKLAYLTVDPTFTQPFSISFFTKWLVNTPIQGPFMITYYINFTNSTGVTLNLANDNAMLAFQHMINATSPSLCFNIDIIFKVFNSSFYQVAISSYCNMTMNQFGFSRIIFDKTAIQALGFCYFQYGQLQSTNGNVSPLTVTINPIFTNNFMMGMKSFNLSSISKIQFATTIGTTTSVASTSLYKYLSFMYWSFKLRVCPAGYPFFIAATLLCYDICPDGMYGNSTSLMCLPCDYTCLTCNSNTNASCLTCNSTNNRILSGTSCPPIYGYYDNNTAGALLCSLVLTNCLECSNNVTCINCTSGYYIDALNTCKLCNISNCVECTSSSSCTICTTGYVITEGVCIFNPCSDPNCLSCPVTASVCTSCVTGTGYLLVSGSCETVCGDGVLAGIQQCDDNNTADGDGCNGDCTIGNANGCPKGTPYKDPVTLTCVATCPNRFYPNSASYTCIACLYTCLTCTNSTDCVTCSATDNRALNGTACSPLPGFYDNNITIAPVCVSPCINCTALTICSSCVSGYYLSGTSCLTCSTITPFCQLCTSNGSVCTLCSPGYIYNSTTLLCDVVPCYDINCLACPNSMGYCNQCAAGYLPINGVCTQICGDFIKVNNQQCDDGNSISKDGCSTDCKIDPDFTCEPNPNNTLGSSCFYVGQVTIDLKYMNKVDGRNEIQVVLDLFPNDLAFWNDVNFLDIMQVQSPVPISGVNIQKNSDGTVSITFQYTESIQGQNINIQIDPSKSGIPALMRTVPSSNSLVVEPNDNEAAYFYDDSVYKMAGVISLLCTAISALALAFFVVGLISGKMIGVQMMAVVQISFFALVTLSHVNPCFAALSSLKLVNGYNSLNHNQLEDPFNPNQPKGIFLFSRFLQNFNFTTAVVLIPLLVALVSFILLKTAFKENQKLTKIFQRSLGEYTLNGLLFSGYLISVSFSLQVMYGIKNTTDLIGKISLAQCCIFLALLIGYFVFLLIKPEFFGQFTEQFKKESKLSSKYYNLMILERIIVGTLLIMLLTMNMEGVVAIAVFILFAILVIVKRPYIKAYNNARVIVNMIIASIVVGIYLYYRMSSEETKQSSSIFFYLPFVICGLLFICVVYNAIALIYTIYQMCKKKTQLYEMDKDQLNQVVKLGKQAQAQGSLSPTQLKNSIQTEGQQTALSIPTNIRKKINLGELKKSMKINNTQLRRQLAPTLINQESIEQQANIEPQAQENSITLSPVQNSKQGPSIPANEQNISKAALLDKNTLGNIQNINQLNLEEYDAI